MGSSDSLGVPLSSLSISLFSDLGSFSIAYGPFIIPNFFFDMYYLIVRPLFLFLSLWLIDFRVLVSSKIVVSTTCIPLMHTCLHLHNTSST